MGLKRYASGAWTDIENVRRNASGVWTDCEGVKKYSGGVWVHVWEKTPYFKFGWVFNENTGGPLPQYVYEPNGNSCRVRVTRGDSSTGRSEIVLVAGVQLEPSSSCNISFNLSDVGTNVGSLYNALAINQAQARGDGGYNLYEMVGYSAISTSAKTYNWTAPDDGANTVTLVGQVYGGSTAYIDFKISNVKINGVAYGFV